MLSEFFYRRRHFIFEIAESGFNMDDSACENGHKQLK